MTKDFIRSLILILLVSSGCGKSKPTVTGAKATLHSATLIWNPSTEPSGTVVANVTVQRGGATIATLPPATITYTDTGVVAGATYSYTVSYLFSNGTVLASSPDSATIPPDVTPPPPPPPPPTCATLAVGCRISVISSAPIRQVPTSSTVLPAQYGTATEPTGALGTVLAISPFGYAPFGVPNWVQVAFDAPCNAAIPGCIGWMGSNNMTLVSGPPPPPPPPPPTLSMTCAGSVCTLSQTNIPSGTAYTVTATSDGKSATATGKF